MERAKEITREMRHVMDEVLLERFRQDVRWGEQNHGPFTWLAILGEEVGEVNRAVLEANKGGDFDDLALADYRRELIQVAAVAMAMIECLDRNEWKLRG